MGNLFFYLLCLLYRVNHCCWSKSHTEEQQRTLYDRVRISELDTGSFIELYSNLISVSEVCGPDSSNMIRHCNHVGECQIRLRMLGYREATQALIQYHLN